MIAFVISILLKMLQLPENIEAKPEFPFPDIQVAASKVIGGTDTRGIGDHQGEVMPADVLSYPQAPGVKPVDLAG